MKTNLIHPLALLCAATLAQAQVSLEHKHTENTVRTVQTEILVQQTLTIAGMDIETKTAQTRVVESSSGKRAEDGSLRVRDQVKKLNAKLNLPGGVELTFDSAAPNEKAPVPQLEMLMDVFRATMKAPATRIYDKQGRLTAVEMPKGAFDGINDLVKPDVNADKLKKEAEQLAGQLPDKAVSKGDTWVRKESMSLGGGQTMRFQVDYEYKGTIEKDGRTLDLIVAKATSVDYEMDANAPGPLKVKNSEMKVADAKTTLHFDRELGLFRETESTLHITGEITFLANGQELPGKVDLTIKSKSHLVTKP
ncbi:MAG: hypothetical protein EXS22_04465 [Pedosphaera sp.]|nr:hypothetical protein [Pedosphaera sp.]